MFICLLFSPACEGVMGKPNKQGEHVKGGTEPKCYNMAEILGTSSQRPQKENE